jgi:hypothetical protein
MQAIRFLSCKRLAHLYATGDRFSLWRRERQVFDEAQENGIAF